MPALAAALASGFTRVDHGGRRWYLLLTADEATTHTTMTTNPWINRCAALALLFMMYAVGISVGRDQAAEAHHNHPACHQGLKP